MRRGNGRYFSRGKNNRHGLTGRDIGLFYRDRQIEKNKQAEKYAMRLRISQSIVAALHEDIQSIEHAARKEHIHLSPKKLKFVKQVARNADFIPLKLGDSDFQAHHVTNIFPRDDDVLYVKTDLHDICDIDVRMDAVDVNTRQASCSKLNSFNDKKLHRGDLGNKPKHTSKKTSDDEVKFVNEFMPLETIIVDSDEELTLKSEIKQTSKTKVKFETKTPAEKMILNDDFIVIDTVGDQKLKSEIKTEIEIINMPDSTVDDAFLIDSDGESRIPPGTAKAMKYSVSNKYAPSTSRLREAALATDFKYGYEDIITGTFEEKLDESLAKGITINMKNATIDGQNQDLLNEYNSMIEDNPQYKKMMEFRKTLPTYKKSEDLLNVINNNQVVVISGETGCGKSTQVPQIILDDAIKDNRGANVKILVTQPRRIAASSLAMRVADERGEKMGKSVGYAVRLERVECRPRASIMFCTTGVLLVDLELDQCLSNYSHIILDEVHERDCQIDISMCMLRQVLKKRKDLKLILMSATIDAESLCAYYDNCPMLHIEGLAYPVKDVYLEEILQMTHYTLPEANHQQNRPPQKWMKFRNRGQRNAATEMEKDIQYKAEIAPWLESIKKNIDREVYKTLQDQRIEQLDINLILDLLIHLSKAEPGAILVFLPGIGEITKLIRAMEESRRFPSSFFEVHPLHSKLPTLTQHQIFQRPPPSKRKIIIATNIAETSITIDDIVYVVDCGKIKYSGLNVDDNVSTLQTEWASQANLRQRRGRAGRCQPGICYHLVTSYRASKLPERLLPELQRNDLLEPVLQIKRLRLGLAEKALNMMPAVPDEKTIQNAVRHLQQCGALDESEKLTPLGWHMARLPVHPAAGKLLLLGALFGCLERAASVAAVWGFKDPFNMCIGKESSVDAMKKNLALGEPSDHIAMSEALIQWELCNSASEQHAFAYTHFLSKNTLKLLSDMKRQFGHNLKQMGFLKSGDVRSMWENRNTNNLSLFKAIIAASLYPNIATVSWRNLGSRNPNKIPYIKARTPGDARVSIHPSSVMAFRHHARNQTPSCNHPGANWLVYWLKQRSSDLYLIDVTLVYTLPLLFFGELNVAQGDTPQECIIEINSIKMCCDTETTKLLFELRSLLDMVLASKIMVSSGETKRHSKFEHEVLNAVIRLITADDEKAEYMDYDDDQSEPDVDHSRGRRW